MVAKQASTIQTSGARMSDRVSDSTMGTAELGDHRLRIGLALSLLSALALASCGQEARSETEMPSAGNQPELTARAASEPNASVDEEARWAAAAFPADGQEPVADPVPVLDTQREPVQSPAPGLAPSRDEPRLIATDMDGTQIIEAEPSEELRGEGALEAEAELMPQEESVAEEPVQEEPVLRDPPAPVVQVAVGEELVFTMEAELNTEDNQPGDVFYAYLSEDLVAADGMVLLPRGVRARGRVLEVRASEDSNELPVLEVQLDELIGEEGDTPIEATIVDAEYEGDARDSDSESVVKVLTGAAAGAILGRILGGDDDDAVKGGVAGAAAGAAVAYGTRGGHAKLAAGAHFTIRLERPLTVF